MSHGIEPHEVPTGLAAPSSPRNRTETCSTSLPLTTTHLLDYPDPPSWTGSMWNPSPSPVTHSSANTHFSWLHHSPAIHDRSVLQNDVRDFCKNRLDLVWEETRKQWAKTQGVGCKPLSVIFPPELQDQAFRNDVELVLPDKQEVGIKQEWQIMWENNALYWTRSRVIARWREESNQRRVLSWSKTGEYHNHTPELWERIVVDAQSEKAIDMDLLLEKLRVEQRQFFAFLTIPDPVAERRCPPLLQPQLDPNPRCQEAGASAQALDNPWQCALDKYDLSQRTVSPIGLDERELFSRPSEANSGCVSDEGSYVSSAASIKDALPRINSAESFLDGSSLRAKRRYSSRDLEANSRAKRSRVESSPFEYKSIPRSLSPSISGISPLMPLETQVAHENPDEKAGLEDEIEAMAANVDDKSPDKAKTNEAHISPESGARMDGGGVSGDPFLEGPERTPLKDTDCISGRAQERSHSPCESSGSLSSLSRISGLEIEYAEHHWSGSLTERLSYPSPGPLSTKEGISHGDEPPSEPISRAMLATEVVSCLVKHGCQDVTDMVNLATFGDHPVSHGGFSDVYCGRLLNGTQVAIKTLRVSASEITQNPKHLKHAARELHTWNKCTHPNVLHLLGLAVFRGRIGMVSPWMSQGNLPRYLELTPGVDRRSLCIQISNGLSYLHEIGIVSDIQAYRLVSILTSTWSEIHGDLKGANVLISDDGAPVLTDFGNSLLIDRSMKFTETTSSSSLTVRWSAAEIINEGLPTEASDIYALAMVIYEVMAGTLPYNGKREAVIINLVVVKKEPPERPDSIPIGCEGGDKRWDLLVRCWSFEPAARPSASEVARTIGQCQ